MQLQLAADGIELGDRGIFESAALIGKNAARVGHGRIEHQLVELVTEIVVSRNIARTALLTVAIEKVEYAHGRLRQERPAAIERVHHLTIRDEEANQCG